MGEGAVGERSTEEVESREAGRGPSQTAQQRNGNGGSGAQAMEGGDLTEEREPAQARQQPVERRRGADRDERAALDAAAEQRGELDVARHGAAAEIGLARGLAGGGVHAALCHIRAVPGEPWLRRRHRRRAAPPERP